MGHGGLPKDVVVFVSRTLVDPIDPCLLVPTKVMGSLCDESSAHFLGAVVKGNAGTEIVGTIPASSG
ncbi:hypothetical protein MB46_06740 [Arthrobacter alpinus]|nr:hypothetical protein MB46_06740 [Arthrobacter alpinus]